MSWHTGTSTDIHDLLVDLRGHINGHADWTQDYSALAVNDANNDDYIAHSTGVTGNDAPYIGIRTYFDSTASVYGLEISGGTGYNSGGASFGLKLTGISPGRYDESTDALRAGAYVPIYNSSMPYWLSVDTRRVCGVIQVDTTYHAFYIGLLDTFADANAYPFPMYVAGSSSRFDNAYNASTPDVGCTLADPIGWYDGSTVLAGPAFLRFTDGAWYTVKNSAHRVSGRIASNDIVVFPAGVPLMNATGIPDPADRWFLNSSSTQFWQETIPNTGNPGSPDHELRKTDGTTANVPIFPATVLMQSPSGQFIGELAGVYWCSGADTVGSEDVLGTGTTYRVFQGGGQTDTWRRMALLEA